MINKFRSWDSRNNEMVFSENSDCFYINTKGVLFMYAIPKSESGLETIYHKSYDVDNFTGLQDKNGVDIYESDIIDDQFDCGQLSIVSYDESKACFILTEIRKEPIYSNSRKFIRALSVCPDSSTKGLVVGNIHSNPELLEQ